MESSTRTTRVSSHTFDSGDNLALRTADSWECEVERPGREGGVGRERRRVHLAVTQRPNLPPVWGTSENSPYPGKQAHAKLPSEPVPPKTHRELLCISRRASSPAAPPSHSPSPAPVSPLPRRPSCPPPTGTVGSGAVYSAAPSDQAGALYGSFVPSEEEGADPTFQIAAAVAGLVAFGAAGKAVADTIAVPGKVYAYVRDFQQFVDDFTEDSRNFINSITP